MRELLLNVGAFLVVLAICAAYLMTQVFQRTPLERMNTAYLNVASTNSILNGTGVFVSGVRVGRVSNVQIVPDGAVLALEYEPSQRIPADSTVTIGLQSALGEPYLNISPGNLSGPMLADGARFKADQVVEPESIPEIFEQITTLSSTVAAEPMAGILKTFSEAFVGNEQEFDKISEATKLVSGLLLAKSGELRTMFANTQVYTANLDWIVDILPDFSAGLQAIIEKFMGALYATEAVVNKGHLNEVMRGAVHPFLAQLQPYLETLVPNAMDAAGPLLPIATALNDTVPVINISELLARALQMLGGGDGMKLVITQPR
ncbi:MAG: MlaD family protein [Nocardioides sp.]